MSNLHSQNYFNTVMRLKRILGRRNRERKNNQQSEYRTIKCLMISMDEDGDSFGDFVRDTFFPKMLNIPPKQCEKCEFEVIVEFKRFVFWKGPSILLQDRSALDQYLMFHRCNFVLLTASKIHQQVKKIYLLSSEWSVLLIGKDAKISCISQDGSFRVSKN